MKQKLAILALVAFTLFQASSAFAESTGLVYHGKNTVESPAEFAGATLHFIINDDTATVVSAGVSGLEVIRMDITPSDACIQTQSTMCFNAEVTDVRNPQIHQIGDKISFTIDFANKKQVGTATSGSLEGTTVTMNIDRMSLKSTAPYTITISREGGFAGFAPKTMTFDPEAGLIVISEGESATNVPLDANTIQQIDQLFQKSRLLNVPSGDYPPVEGSADYFMYGLTLNQGIFQSQFSWTDTSDDTPQILSELHNTIWTAGEQNIPIPVDIPSEDLEITEIAREFVISSPTFAFDGMEETLEFGPITILESFPVQYGLEASFTSSHGGFGDRTDQIVTQVLTPHVMSILISEGQVISAVTDGEWDELNNQFVLKAP
jgi:hypothetical protein